MSEHKTLHPYENIHTTGDLYPHPPATILTISSRSPACNWRLPNSDGATACPLCSTTTLRGKSCCATRNSSSVHGTRAGTSFPLAIIIFELTASLAIEMPWSWRSSALGPQPLPDLLSVKFQPSALN